MADSSLDDFFAKKDKSKKKTKSKSSDVDDGSKSVKKEKKKKDKDNPSGSGLNRSTTKQQGDDEWNDFEEEKEVDYSGLRIQNMQIAKEQEDKENASGDDEGEDEYDDDGEKKKSGASGPWNKSNDSNTEKKKKSVPEPEPVKEEVSTPGPKLPGKYVPPGARNATPASSTPSFPSRRNPKVAPNLQNELDFPSLGGGPASATNNQYSSGEPMSRKGVNLTLENKFSALQD